MLVGIVGISGDELLGFLHLGRRKSQDGSMGIYSALQFDSATRRVVRGCQGELVSGLHNGCDGGHWRRLKGTLYGLDNSSVAPFFPRADL